MDMEKIVMIPIDKLVLLLRESVAVTFAVSVEVHQLLVLTTTFKGCNQLYPLYSQAYTSFSGSLVVVKLSDRNNFSNCI
jgi:hypothetical protein